MKPSFEKTAIARSFAILAPILVGGWTAAALAQPDAGTLLNQEQRSRQRLPDRLPEPEAEPVRPALKEVPGGVRVVVRSVRFAGATGLAQEAELQAVVADAIGRELDFAGLEKLARRVTEFLRAKGWFLAEAYLPRQDVTDGHIEIAIRPGRLDGGSGKGEPFFVALGGKLTPRIDPARLNAIAAGLLEPGAVARESEMERAMLLMNDLPGITARARLEPGVEAGSTRVVVDAEEGPLLTGTVSADNYGNRDTGLYQLNLAAQLNDPTGYGDQAAVAATHADGLDLARLSYSIPVGSRGTKLGASLTAMDYRIMRGTGLAAGLEGSSETVGVTLSHPFLRSRADNIYGTLAFNHKALTDDSSAGRLRDKRVDVANLALSGDHLDTVGGGGLASWNLGWTEGRVDLSRIASDAATDAATYGTQGRYAKLTYSLARLQKLSGPFALYAGFAGQTAGRNLDSSEKFMLGGPTGVRAYSGSEASGDSGWLANLELRYDLPGGTSLGPLQFVAFYDAGHIVLHDDTKNIPIATYTQRNAYGLSGWGLGMNLARTGSHSIRLAWAQKIGDNPGRSVAGLDADSRADKSRLWLQATLWF